MPVSTDLGREFAEALAVKDFDRIAAIFDPNVRLRGATPGRFWEVDGCDAAIEDVLKLWFEDTDHITGLISCESGRVVDRDFVSYRFTGENGDGPFIVEQQAYYDVEDGRIKWMSVLCSGFRPVPAQA
jgi:hypothetical protein